MFKLLNNGIKEGLIEWSSTGNPRKIIYAEEKLGRGKGYRMFGYSRTHNIPFIQPKRTLRCSELIIRTSSNPGSLVLDCFCGSGTTLKAAHLNGRKWIGIDNSEIAIRATIAKLESVRDDLFTHKPEYEFIDLEEAGLAEHSKDQNV